MNYFRYRRNKSRRLWKRAAKNVKVGDHRVLSNIIRLRWDRFVDDDAKPTVEAIFPQRKEEKMSVRSTAQRYGSVAMSLHWLIAALVIANICIGLYMGDLPRGDPTKFQLFALHKSIGLSVLALSVLRVLWRLANPVPPSPAGLPPILKLAGRAVHFLLYFLIVAIPLAGWLMVSVGSMGHPTQVFGLFGWPSFPILADMPRSAGHPYHEAFETAHVWLAWSAIILIPLHVGAALYHQFVRRDDVLKRMLPGTRLQGNA
jgi:cytochrome b561